MDDKYYLEKGMSFDFASIGCTNSLDFDAKLLKVAQLRGILNEYAVPFASNAKKAQLVTLFDENIKFRRDLLLNEYNYKINHGNNDGFVKGNKSPVPEKLNQEPKEKKESHVKKSKKSKKITVEEYDKIVDAIDKVNDSKKEKNNKARKSNDDEEDTKEPKKQNKEKSNQDGSKDWKKNEKKDKSKSTDEDDTKHGRRNDKLDEVTKDRKHNKQKSHLIDDDRKKQERKSQSTDESGETKQRNHKKSDNLDISNSKDIIDHKMTPSKTFLAITSESSFSNENSFQSKKRKRISSGDHEQAKRLKSPTKSIFDSDSEEIEILSPQKTPFKVKRPKNSPKEIIRGDASPKSSKDEGSKIKSPKVTKSVVSPSIKDEVSDLTKVASPKVKVSPPTPKVNKVEKIKTPNKIDKIKTPKVSKTDKIVTPKVIKIDKIETPKLDKIEDSVSPEIIPEAGVLPKSSSKKAPKPSSANTSQHTIIQASPSTQKNTWDYSFRSADKSFNNQNQNPSPLTKSSPKINNKSTTVQLSDDEEEAPPAGSIEAEAAAFDKGLDRINRKNIKSDGVDLDLASQLGVTVEGYNPTPRKSTITTPISARSSAKVSRKTTPSSSSKSTPSSLPRLTPKPRLQHVTDANISSDEEDEEDTTSGITENIEKKIVNLEKSIEQESKQVIKKLKVHVRIVPLILTFLTWSFLVSLGLFGYWYHQQVYLIGYCGQEINTKTFPNTEYGIVEKFGNYLDNNFKPSCIPCPNHARCFPNLELGCFEDFVEYKPWNNFLFPTKKKCIPDTKKAEKLEIMIEVALDLLRTKNARKNCGISEDIEEAGVKLNDLHDLLLSMKAPYITTKEFEELWGRSVIELEKESDIIVRHVAFSEAQQVY